MPRRYWLPAGEGTELAEHQLQAFGWTATEQADWDLAWTLDLPDDHVFVTAQSGRWINHLVGIGVLATKSRLALALREAAARAAECGVGGLCDFAPQTFVLPAEWDQWATARAWDPDAVWIQKPADSSRGRGVALITNPREIAGANVVVQRYISNPHLLDGYKYSLRFYVLVASLDPLIAYLFDGGFTKLASRPFSLAAGDRADRFRHLTNPDILRDDPEAAGVSTRNTTHRAYRERLRSMDIDDALLWQRIRRALATTVAAAVPSLRADEHHVGGTGTGHQFELLGIDITVDDTLKPWLLECNLAPSLSVEASAATDASRDETDIKTRVVRDTLHLVGASELDQPGAAPSTPQEARDRLRSLDARRGGFDRLWPSADALASLAGTEWLSELDRALLDDTAARDWPEAPVNHVETITAGTDSLVFDPRQDRVTLLDRDEAAAWVNRRGFEWLRLGWLAPPDLIATSTPARPALLIPPRRRTRWNRERVYEVHGLRVAIAAANRGVEDAVDRALGWHEADHLEDVDARLLIARRGQIPDALAHIDRLALDKLDVLVRRRIAVMEGDNGAVLWLDNAPAEAGSRWIMFGGTPFGPMSDDGGPIAPLRVAAIVSRSPSASEVLLDLVSAAPGVIRAFDAGRLRRLAEWLETIALRPSAGN